MKFADRAFFEFMRNLKLITASILAILVAIIVVQNREPVATHVLFATVVMAHAILLFITSAAGFALGGPSHTVAKHKAESNPLRRSARWRFEGATTTAPRSSITNMPLMNVELLKLGCGASDPRDKS